MRQRKIVPIVQHIIPPIIGLWVKKVTGVENLPMDRAFIISPNHASYIEHLMIGCIVIPSLNKKLHFIAKKEHFRGFSQSAWHSLWSKYITYIPIDRKKGEKALEKAIYYLKKGAVIVIYPEGTRSITGRIQKGKTGVARLALSARVPVVPLGIKGTFEILPKGKMVPRLKKATLNFGKPMHFDKYYGKKITKRLLRQVTNQIMAEIARLSGQKYNY